jgi:transposase
MPFIRKTMRLNLSEDEINRLKNINSSRIASHSKVVRSGILLDLSEGKSTNSIAKKFGVSRPLVDRVLSKAISGGIEFALKDLARTGRPPRISADDKTWVTSIACTKPKELGYASEAWTIRSLAKYIREHCEETGHPNLLKAEKSLIHGILNEFSLRPHKMSYYLERRDPDFDEKMAQVLTVYKEVEIVNEQEKTPNNENSRSWVVISCDEKPGIQAIGNIAPDLPPVPGKHPSPSRDYEYKRNGTLSLIAGIDLHSGEITGIVRERHRSLEFTELLGALDLKYPKDWKIRMILDNHTVHASKETLKWLKDYPDRFEFVFTPKHASWLNIVEVFFSKMTRSFLRHLRVTSKDELKQRMEQYLEEVNSEPVIFRWKYKMNEVLV